MSTLNKIASTIFLATLVSSTTCVAVTAPVSGYRVVNTFPHSTDSYTEGFFYLDGLFYEGSGLNGHSAMTSEKIDSGQVLQRAIMAPQYFGEGIVEWKGLLYQWTWKSHICFIYNRITFQPVRSLSYTGEGWGMTHNATHIITSDGTNILRFRNPDTFKEERHITVTDDDGHTVDNLNELEWVKGEIYANIWHDDRIARISPTTGHVLGWIDLTGILPNQERRGEESVLNGIAYDASHDRLFVTGKNWPRVFEIKIVPKR